MIITNSMMIEQIYKKLKIYVSIFLTKTFARETNG